MPAGVTRKARTATGIMDKFVEKLPVRAATLANVASLSSVSTTFGGVTLVKGNRVLLAGQSTGSQNGIYVAGAVSGGNTSLTRAADFNEGDEVGLEVVVAVQAGTYLGKRYRVSATGVVGTDTITFTEMPTSLTASSVLMAAAAELTIATGVVTATQSYHSLDTEADAASDDLDTISGLSDGQFAILRLENAARNVVLKHGTGNLVCPGGFDLTLDAAADAVLALRLGSSVIVVGFCTADLAAGGLGKALSSGATGKGASMVTLEDAAGLYATDTVEAALAALRTVLVTKAATELTIAAGVVTATQTAHRIDTEADGASDDLDTINGGAAEQILLLRPENGARTVVLKHNSGNIICPDAADISLADAQDFALLVYANSKWTVVAASTLVGVYARPAAATTFSSTLAVTGQLSANGGASVAGATPAAAADKVGYGVADVEGATTAAEERTFEGGGKLRERMMSAAGDVDVLRWSGSLTDDSTFNLGAYPTNGGRVTVSCHGEGGMFSIHSDGTTTKLCGSTNLENSDADDKLDVFPSGGNVTVRNRLGGTRWVMVTYERD